MAITLESLADQVATLQLAVNELLNRIRGPLNPGEPADGMIGPGRTAFRGGYLDLVEPLAADWLPTQAFYTFVAQGQVGYEPSNGLPGAPLRSPAGYPLVYALGFDADGRRIAVGAPRISFNGQTFANDAEIEQHKEWLKTRPPAGDNFSPRPR